MCGVSIAFCSVLVDTLGDFLQRWRSEDKTLPVSAGASKNAR